MSIPEDKTAADRAAEEEKMEIERGIRLLDASTDNISTRRTENALESTR